MLVLRDERTRLRGGLRVGHPEREGDGHEQGGAGEALGGQLGYDFKVGQTPVTTRVKVLRDVEVQNRFAGTTLFVSVAFPLWVAHPKAGVTAVTVTVMTSGCGSGEDHPTG
jgi:hypothetical protein